MSNVLAARLYTLEIRISNEDAAYFKEYSPVFAKLCRRIWQDLKHGVDTNSKYVTKLCQDNNIIKRSVNSALRFMKGRMNTLKELQKVQIIFFNNDVVHLSF